MHIRIQIITNDSFAHMYSLYEDKATEHRDECHPALCAFFVPLCTEMSKYSYYSEHLAWCPLLMSSNLTFCLRQYNVFSTESCAQWWIMNFWVDGEELCIQRPVFILAFDQLLIN